jgi:hypothetical protein
MSPKPFSTTLLRASVPLHRRPVYWLTIFIYIPILCQLESGYRPSTIVRNKKGDHFYFSFRLHLFLTYLTSRRFIHKRRHAPAALHERVKICSAIFQIAYRTGSSIYRGDATRPRRAANE